MQLASVSIVVRITLFHWILLVPAELNRTLQSLACGKVRVITKVPKVYAM